MALSKSQKATLIDRYSNGLAAAPHAFLVSFQGLTVNQATDLRDRIRKEGGSYEVVKNTLALRAVDGKGLGELSEFFSGPTAVAYHMEDPVGLAKALTDFRKEVPKVEFKAGLVDGRPVDVGQIEEIAKMPSREELLAKLLFLMRSPITNFVRTLAAIPRSFVVVLDQIAKQKEEG